MSLFLSSDHHFSHSNIIFKFQFRPFWGIEDMQEQMIARHNSRVTKADRVVFLGDLFWRTCKNSNEILNRLNGQKHYVTGNHEEALRWTDLSLFASVGESYKVDLKPYGIKEAKYIYCHHFAHRVWPRSHTGSWHAYGHSHGQLPDDPKAKSLDVGVDTHDYYPWSLEEITRHMQDKGDKLSGPTE